MKTSRVGGERIRSEGEFGKPGFFYLEEKKSNSLGSHFSFPNDIFEKSAAGESKSMANFSAALGISPIFPVVFLVIFGDFP